MLERGLAQSNVAASPKPEPADCLGQGPLDPSAASILLSPLHGFLPAPGLLNGLVFGLRAEGKRAGIAVSSMGALRACGAGGAGWPGKADTNAFAAPLVEGQSPMRGDLPLWTGDRVRVPINPECREVVSLSRLGLPAGVGEQRTDKLDPMIDGRGLSPPCPSLAPASSGR